MGLKMHPLIRNFVRTKIEEEVEDLLDDPSSFSHPDDPDDIKEWYGTTSMICRLVGLDLNQLLATKGTEIERKRLHELLAKKGIGDG
jgi:hypothetical protein